MSTYWTTKKVHLRIGTVPLERRAACKVQNKSLAIKVTEIPEEVTCKRCQLYIDAEKRRNES